MDISTELRSHQSNFSFNQLDKTKPQEPKNESCSMLVIPLQKERFDNTKYYILHYDDDFLLNKYL